MFQNPSQCKCPKSTAQSFTLWPCYAFIIRWSDSHITLWPSLIVEGLTFWEAGQKRRQARGTWFPIHYVNIHILQIYHVREFDNITFGELFADHPASRFCFSGGLPARTPRIASKQSWYPYNTFNSLLISRQDRLKQYCTTPIRLSQPFRLIDSQAYRRDGGGGGG